MSAAIAPELAVWSVRSDRSAAGAAAPAWNDGAPVARRELNVGSLPADHVLNRLVSVAMAASLDTLHATSRYHRLRAEHGDFVGRVKAATNEAVTHVLGAEVMVQLALWGTSGIEVQLGSAAVGRLREAPWTPSWIAFLPADAQVCATVDDRLALLGPPMEQLVERHHRAIGHDEGLGL